MTDIYDRQKMLTLREVPVATVVGVGGTGSWVALFLAMSGTKRIILMDGDKTELTNFNRLPIPVRGNLGELKTEVIAKMLETIRPDCIVEQEGKANGFTLASTEGTIFDCTDNPKVQQMIYTFAKEHNREYIRVGYDGTHITVHDRVPKWGNVERTGYEVFPSWVVPAAMAACFGVTKAMHNTELVVTGDIGKLTNKQDKEVENDKA